MRRTTILCAISWYTKHAYAVSRAYPKGCSREPPEYYNYDSLPFPPTNLPARTHDDYALLRRLGAGKFSDVFEAVEVDGKQFSEDSDEFACSYDPSELCVIKVSWEEWAE